ncbi:hypothetical protein sos41_32910 [Alphaproteobacteria bacterium SO-S41]|nr:hypothetical protein sos41_32910 [Alphaproteobacteria bacterium SO-S41]
MSDLPGQDRIERFIRDGFVKLENVFPEATAAACRAILWRETGCDPADPATWTQPVIRLGGHSEAPFRDAATAPVLEAAFDQLVGPGAWVKLGGLGTFPIRFPSMESAGDDGWHIDMSFGGTADDFLSWRANVASDGRALLLLVLLSEVGEDDAPTRLRVGSHVDIARRLAPVGEAGLSLRELAATGFAESAGRREVAATGAAGTVYLCHPFLVHAAQRHRGGRVKFMAQPPLFPVGKVGGAVAAATRRALA